MMPSLSFFAAAVAAAASTTLMVAVTTTEPAAYATDTALCLTPAPLAIVFLMFSLSVLVRDASVPASVRVDVRVVGFAFAGEPAGHTGVSRVFVCSMKSLGIDPEGYGFVAL